MVPNAKVELGELMFLPWDDPVAPRVDELDKNFPLAAKGDCARGHCTRSQFLDQTCGGQGRQRRQQESDAG